MSRRPGLILTVLALLSSMGSAAHGEPGGPLEPQLPKLPGWLKPPSGIPFFTKEEKKVLDCLGKAYTERGFYASLYGDEPAPSVPNQSASCRVSGVARVVASFAPPTLPPDLALRTDDLGAIQDRGLREYLAGVVEAASAWDEVLVLERKLDKRFESMLVAAASLEDKITRLNASASTKWPEHWTGFTMQNSQCLADTPEAQEEAVRKLKAEYDAFLLYDDYAALAFAASLGGQEVIPDGISYCEKGAEQKKCFTPRPRDWSMPGCWDHSTPSQYSQVQCADDSGGLISKLKKTGAGSGCNLDIQKVLPPFFSERKKVVASRRASSSYKPDLEQFTAAIEQARLAVESSRPAFVQARVAAVTRIRPQYAKVTEQLALENARLATEQASIDVERGALAVLAASIDSRKVKVADLAATIAQEVLAREKARQDLDAARAANAAAAARLQSARTTLDSARSRRAQLSLDCAGHGYADCPDEAAKLRFDESLYKAMAEIDAAMDDWSKAMDEVAQAMDRQMLAEQRAIEADGSLADRRVTMADERILLVREQDQYAARKKVADARQENHDVLEKGHARDDERLARFRAEIS